MTKAGRTIFRTKTRKVAKRKGRPINGWLNLDKPQGLTSTQAIGRVRRLTQAAKLGHGGTLDPLATGVLPIALGEATKTLPYVVDSEKAYEFTVAWGEERDTDDAEGEVVAQSDQRPDKAAIEAMLPRFTGVIEQVPPAFSAIKVDGKRAYDLSRRGEAVELAPREVEIHSLELLAAEPEQARFAMTCGKGTYVRSLARDLARALGTRGHVTELRRTRVGPFHAAAAISLDMLEDMVHSAPPEKILLPVETALDGIPALAVTGGEAKRLQSGQVLHVPSRKSGVVRVMVDDALVALAAIEHGELRPLRVFNL